MTSTKPFRICRPLILGLAMAFLRAPGEPANAQAPHLTTPQPGGMPGWPVITGVTRPTNGQSRITWDGTPGSAGYYQLYHKRSLKDAGWQAVGAARSEEHTSELQSR